MFLRVRRFRFSREIDQKSDAFAYLLEKGLEAVEREEQKAEKKRS